MKKIILFLLLPIMPLIGFSQSVFDKYEDIDKVGAVTINQSMIQMAGNLAAFDESDSDAQDLAEIAQSLEGIKIYMTEDVEMSKDMSATVKEYLNNSPLEELMQVSDKDANVKFYVKEGNDSDHVSELLLFVSEINNPKLQVKNRKFESIIVSMTGDIDLNKIGALTSKLGLPKELEQAKPYK